MEPSGIELHDRHAICSDCAVKLLISTICGIMVLESGRRECSMVGSAILLAQNISSSLHFHPRFVHLLSLRVTV